MTILVIADHDHAKLKPGTANAVTAAAKMGGDIHVLVAGAGCAGAAEAAAARDDPPRGHQLGPRGFREFLADELRLGGVGAGGDRLDGRGAGGGGLLEAGGAHRHDLDRVGGLHRREGVAGVDRTHERVGRFDGDDL